MGYDVVKTEHAGAKNGGGYWGPRVAAKQGSRKVRRQIERQAIEEAIEEAEDERQLEYWAWAEAAMSEEAPYDDPEERPYVEGHLDDDEDPYLDELNQGGEAGEGG